jgi:hypothetical protein
LPQPGFLPPSAGKQNQVQHKSIKTYGAYGASVMSVHSMTASPFRFSNHRFSTVLDYRKPNSQTQILDNIIPVLNIALDSMNGYNHTQ